MQMTMNKLQREVIRAELNEEKDLLDKLKETYNKAKDDCVDKITELSRRRDMEHLQSIIWQKQYQQALKKQIDGVLDTLNSESFDNISDYLNKCYENGYVGAAYDIAGQGIPLIMAMNPELVARALQTDSKISQGLYERLGEDTNNLKKVIRAQLSRGIANGSSWNEIAAEIANCMNSPFNQAYNNAARIARTEGHRIQCQSAMDAQREARERGADIVKQWDATLDNRTRKSHQKVDGELRELDEMFSNGLMFPGDPQGTASEVINCRCALLQRARWALDKNELEELRKRAAYFALDKTANFDEYKDKYLNINKQLENLVEDDTIKLRINLFDKRDPLYLEALSIEEIPGFEDLCAHGSPTSIERIVNGKRVQMNASELAEYIRQSTNYSGGNIRLASCSTGYGDNSIAQQLSKELGVTVMAPDSDLYYLPDEGTVFVGSPYGNVGTWRIFKNGVEEK